MRNIEFLLEKYDKNYVKGEFRDIESVKKIMAENYQKERIRVAKTLCASVNASHNIVEQVCFRLDTIRDVQFINRRWTLEKIVSLMIICEFQLQYDSFDIKSLYLWEHYNFTYKTFESAKSRYYKHILANSRWIGDN